MNASVETPERKTEVEGVTPYETRVRFPKKLQALFEPGWRYKVAYGGRGGAKCLALGTKVIMADGSLRAVEDVRVGDAVMGPDSLPRNVLAVTRGLGDLYRVKQTSANDYTVNADHVLSLKKSGSSPKDKGPRMQSGNFRRPRGRYPDYPTIANMRVTDVLAQSNRWREHFRGYRAGLISFPAREVLIEPWFLGIWLGDGLHRELMITNADEEIMDGIREYGATFGLGFTRRQPPNNKAYDIRLPRQKGTARTNPLWQRFVAYGLPSNKHIPSVYLRNTEEVRLHLLAGLLDSDGHSRKNGYYIAQVNERLARDIKYLADSLGFRTNFVKRRTICTNNGVRGEAFGISINGDVWRIPCRVPRKRIHEADVSKNKDWLLSQVSIELIGVGEYAGFALDGDHLFLLEDGTVTHNSWNFARACLIRGVQRSLRILCGREMQKSIDESVHQTLIDQIQAMELEEFYGWNQKSVWGKKNKTQFLFAGLWMNIDSIKSKEGLDLAWIEEAHKVSKNSWEKLIPTLRKDAPGGPNGTGAEIWVSYNVELESDETHQRFVVKPPASAKIIQIGWRDNPWFPKVLRDEMIEMRERNYDDYLHVYEGHPKQFLEGAVYKEEMQAAELAGRITAVPYNEIATVNLFFDLGWRDMTAVWFVQRIGLAYHVINYWEGRRAKVASFLKMVQDDKEMGRYIIGTFYLPHDAGSEHQAADGGSIEDLFRAQAGGRGVVVQKPGDIANGVNLARTVFSQCWFDRERCADGLQRLRHYRYEIDEKTKLWTKLPIHDDNSHGADAFRGFAVSTTSTEGIPALKLPPPRISVGQGRDHGWMGN